MKVSGPTNDASQRMKLKRKQNKLKDMLSALVQKYQETDTRDRKKNDDLPSAGGASGGIRWSEGDARWEVRRMQWCAR